MVVRALWRSEALRVVPWLRPCTRLRLVQGLRPRHNPACLWSPQCTANHSKSLKQNYAADALGQWAIDIDMITPWYEHNPRITDIVYGKTIVITSEFSSQMPVRGGLNCLFAVNLISFWTNHRSAIDLRHVWPLPIDLLSVHVFLVFFSYNSNHNKEGNFDL